MAVDKHFSTLGDMLLKTYVTDYIAQMQQPSMMEQFFKEDLDLEKVIKEANEVSFGDLYEKSDR